MDCNSDGCTVTNAAKGGGTVYTYRKGKVEMGIRSQSWIKLALKVPSRLPTPAHPSADRDRRLK